MGSLLTPNLKLLAPDDNDPVPNFPGINDYTCDRLDNFLGPMEMQQFVPGISIPNIGTGGAAFALGRYYLFLDMVIFWMKFGFGTGFDGGPGTWFFNLPFPPFEHHAAGTHGGGDIIGTAGLGRGGASSIQTGIVQLASSENSTVLILTEKGSPSRIVNSSSPGSWTSGDQLTLSGKYRRAI